MVIFVLVGMGCGIIPVIGAVILMPPLQLGFTIFYIRFYRYGETDMENLFKGYWLSQLLSHHTDTPMLILYDNPEILMMQGNIFLFWMSFL
jgi:hypothetical protein